MSQVSGKADPYARASKRYYQSLSHSSVGLQLGLSVLIGVGAGYWADDRWGTSPWLTLVGLAFGSVAGFRAVYYASLREAKADQNADQTKSQATTDAKEPPQ